MSDLGPDARELIAQVGDRDGPSRSDRERVRRLVSASLAAASTAATSASLAAGAAGTVGTSLAKSIGIAQIALWVGVGSAVGAAVAAPVLLSDSPASRSTPARPSPRALAPSNPRARVAVAPAIASSEPALLDAGVETAATPPPAVRQAPPPKPAPPPADPTSTAAFPAPAPATTEGGLRAETRLLEQAQRARARGRADEALALLRTYRVRFPGGALHSESLVMQVLCLCELGRQADAQALAQELVRLHPESPLVPRLSRSCVTLPSD